VVGALGRVGRAPAPELRIRQHDHVLAVAVGGHVPQERGHRFIEGLQQPLLGFAFVGAGVEPAELHHIDAGRTPARTALVTMASCAASGLRSFSDALTSAEVVSVVRVTRRLRTPPT
jgi:hypothetical protein